VTIEGFVTAVKEGRIRAIADVWEDLFPRERLQDIDQFMVRWSDRATRRPSARP
jgi:hypothetical protein